MKSILAFQLDAKLLLLTNRMRFEVTFVFAPFLHFLHKFDPRKTHMMLALMFDPKFKDLFILSNNYVGIENGTIARRYDFETLIPLFCLAYQNVCPFIEHPSNSSPQE
jgi:hypothetical protein